VPDQFPIRSGTSGTEGVAVGGVVAGVVVVGADVMQPATRTIPVMRMSRGIHFIVPVHCSIEIEKDDGRKMREHFLVHFHDF
jgi:hypothetical protein